MFGFLRTIPETVRGILFLVFGALLLLFTLGLFHECLKIIIVIASLIIMAYGFLILNGHRKLMKIIEKESQQQKPGRP